MYSVYTAYPFPRQQNLYLFFKEILLSNPVTKVTREPSNHYSLTSTMHPLILRSVQVKMCVFITSSQKNLEDKMFAEFIILEIPIKYM